MENMENRTERPMENRDTLSGQWKQLRGTLKSWWGKLTDDDLERIAGYKDRLIGMLQEKYGYARDMAQREVDRRLREYNESQSHMNPSTSSGATSSGGATTYGGTAENVAQTVRNTGERMGQSASQTYTDLKEKAQEAGATISQKVSTAPTSVGEGMRSLAGTIRENAPASGAMGSAASTVAEQLDAAGSYLQENSFQNMANDLAALIRRYPLQSLAIGLGIGFLVARGGGRER
jgi:uncharacterized protein YjbJ (UPF0337 family)